MKKRVLLGVLALTMTMGSVPVLAAEDSNTECTIAVSQENVDEFSVARASDYIASYAIDVESNVSGSATAAASMLRMTGDTNKITVTLQEKVNGSWKNIDSASFKKTSKMLSCEPEFDTEKGHTYRFKGSFQVLVNGSAVEARTAYTSSFTGK